jgi:hypothetical protein
MSKSRKKRSPAGQPPTDIVLRLRNWIWYSEVKASTGLSDEALDTRYLPGNSKSGGRLRLFQRIRSIGSNPAQPRADLENQSIFDRVHAESSLALDAAAQNFRSPLWRMLGEPGYAQRDFAGAIDGLIAARQWYRATPGELRLAYTSLPDDVEFREGFDQKNAYEAMLTLLESTPCADHIALLGALFFEAMHYIDFQRAALLFDAALLCIERWMQKLGWQTETRKSGWQAHADVFANLVHQRLFRNMWIEPSIARRHHGNQRKFVKALLGAHRSLVRRLEHRPTADVIVFCSHRIEWLLENRQFSAKATRNLPK